MKSEQFVKCLREEVIGTDFREFLDLLKHAPDEPKTHEFWRVSRALFESLDNKQQELFIKMLRQVAINTASGILGVLDGQCVLQGFPEAISLRCENDSTELSGFLQEEFLTQEQRAGSFTP